LLNTASKNLLLIFGNSTEPLAILIYCYYINGIFVCILMLFLVSLGFSSLYLENVYFDAVDLPFALPTSVAGLTSATVYSDQGWIGSFI